MPALSTPIVRAASFDESGAYRYSLTRSWGAGRRIAFVLLNPSTADATADDPTIRRCIGFAQALGFGSLEVVNLCALRSTDPTALARHPDPIGPANADAIARAIARADLTVAGWGNHGARYVELLPPEAWSDVDLHCFGLTKLGQPRHPLYLPSAARPVPYAKGPRVCAAPCESNRVPAPQAMVPADRSSAIFAASKPIELSTSSVC